MRESAESRSAAVRAVLLRFYPHQYPWGESCAVTVSFLLRFTEAAHDSVVRNSISNHTAFKASRLFHFLSLHNGGLASTTCLQARLSNLNTPQSGGAREGGDGVVMPPCPPAKVVG